jgi:hypothetical protein
MHKFPEPMAKFPVSVPIDLKRRFKAKCATEGTLMSEAIRKLLVRECGVGSKPTKPTEPAEKAA